MGKLGHQLLFLGIGLCLGQPGFLQFIPHDVEALRKGPEQVPPVHSKGDVQVAACHPAGEVL